MNIPDNWYEPEDFEDIEDKESREYQEDIEADRAYELSKEE